MEMPIMNISLVADADLTASQYKAIKINSAGKAVLAGAGEKAVGVLQNTPAKGQTACVTVVGMSFGSFGAAVAAGDSLEVNAEGQFITRTTGEAVAVAVSGGDADNVIGSVLLK
jgi:hypothetical protein